MIKVIILVSFSFFLFSCNKENPTKQKTDSPKTETHSDNENDTDTSMTAEEAFSSALVQDIAGDDDDDLRFYLEEQLFPVVSKSKKVTLDRVSSSLYLLSYDDGGNEKNIMIQKFYNPLKDEFVFEKSETQTNSIKQFVK